MGAINCGSPERTRSLLPHLSSSHTFIDLFAYCLMGTTCLWPAQQHAVLTNYLVAHYKGALVYIIFNKHDFSLLTSKLLKLIYVHLCWQTSFSVKSAKNSGEPFLFLLYKVHPNYIGFEFFLSSTNCSLEKFKEIKKKTALHFLWKMCQLNKTERPQLGMISITLPATCHLAGKYNFSIYKIVKMPMFFCQILKWKLADFFIGSKFLSAPN